MTNASPSNIENRAWSVNTLNVGQADAHQLVTPSKQNVLFDADEDQIVTILNKDGSDVADTKIIDHFVVTHLHDDHIDGLKHLNNAGYSIRDSYQPNADRVEIGNKDGYVKRDVIDEYLSKLSEQDIEMQNIIQLNAGDEILDEEEEVSLNVLSPPSTSETARPPANRRGIRAISNRKK